MFHQEVSVETIKMTNISIDQQYAKNVASRREQNIFLNIRNKTIGKELKIHRKF